MDGVLLLLSILVFPVSFLVLILALLTTFSAGLIYVSVLLMLVQYPFYGFLMSLSRNRRRFILIAGTVHIGIAMFGLAIFLVFFGWRALIVL